jgi:cobalt/nickel transport system ATP-binding protein
MSPLIELHAVDYRYPDGSAGLDGCSLRIAAGSRNALLGANGSGKTTLLLHLNGLLQASAGRIDFAGQPLAAGREALNALRRRVGLVFQNPDRQLFSASVVEDVSFGPLNLGLDEATVRQRVGEAMAAVGLADLADKPVHHLSFGQKKRVCIAGVLAMQPEVLLLDEPMAGLDAGMQDELLALLNTLSARGITILLSTHDVDFAYRWAEQIHLLAAGRCIASFATDQLPQQASALYAAGQPLPAVVDLHLSLCRLGRLAASPVPRSLSELASLLKQEENACKLA